MYFSNIIRPEGIIPKLKVSSKKQALQELASCASHLTTIEEREIFDVLIERERLGTTGVGNGVAIPHGKLNELNKLYGFFARLENPINFDSIDDRPVDLIFLLLAPEEAGADHLKALAKVSRVLRDEKMCEKLRGSGSSEAIFAMFTEED
ncbi:MAG: PTS IIA-like nitrogen regulatory protein PtsN [Alphaproteobacteria bacterium]